MSDIPGLGWGDDDDEEEEDDAEKLVDETPEDEEPEMGDSDPDTPPPPSMEDSREGAEETPLPGLSPPSTSDTAFFVARPARRALTSPDSDDAASSSANGHSSSQEEWCIVVDVMARTLALQPADFDAERYCQLTKLSPEDSAKLGIPVKEAQAKDDDSCIYCDSCDRFFRGSCREHPLFWVTDRTDRSDAGGGGGTAKESRAQRTLPNALFRIRPSAIPNAGRGVFANMDIPVGMVFGPYQGVKIEDPKKADAAGYSWEIRNKPRNVYIDGSDPEYSNWMRFINSARHEGEQNLIAFQYCGKVYYRVFRPIDINKELLVWYGSNYAKTLGICTTETTPSKNNPLKGNPFIL